MSLQTIFTEGISPKHVEDCFSLTLLGTRVAQTAPHNDVLFSHSSPLIQQGWWQPFDCHHCYLPIYFGYTRTLQGLLTAASAVVEVLDVPHLAIGGWVHDEIAHIRTGCR
jgi:hypothetical protein